MESKGLYVASCIGSDLDVKQGVLKYYLMLDGGLGNRVEACLGENGEGVALFLLNIFDKDHVDLEDVYEQFLGIKTSIAIALVETDTFDELLDGLKKINDSVNLEHITCKNASENNDSLQPFHVSIPATLKEDDLLELNLGSMSIGKIEEAEGETVTERLANYAIKVSTSN